MASRTKTILLVVGGLVLGWVAVIVLAAVVVEFRVPVTLPPRFGAGLTRLSGDYVRVDGTWTINGEPQGDPVQTTQVRCERLQNRCSGATALIQGGVFEKRILNVVTEEYDVVSWSASQIVFRNDAAICVDYIYTIDLLTEAVAGRRVRKSTSPKADELCALLEDDLRLTLVDGYELSRKWRRDALPWFGRLAGLPFGLFFGW